LQSILKGTATRDMVFFKVDYVNEDKVADMVTTTNKVSIVKGRVQEIKKNNSGGGRLN
jgi:hypothetical protein